MNRDLHEWNARILDRRERQQREPDDVCGCRRADPAFCPWASCPRKARA